MNTQQIKKTQCPQWSRLVQHHRQVLYNIIIAVMSAMQKSN